MKSNKSILCDTDTDDEDDSHAGQNRGFVTATSNSVTLSSGSTFDGSEEGEVFDNDHHGAGFASLLAAAHHQPSMGASFPPPMDDVVL